MNSPQSKAMQRSATRSRCDRTGAWQALKNHYDRHGRGFDLRDAFARHADRFEVMGVQAPEVYADLSKNLLDPATLQLLLDLARECGVESRRDAMFDGQAVNITEGRAVLHTALRRSEKTPLLVGGHDITPEVRHEREHLLISPLGHAKVHHCGRVTDVFTLPVKQGGRRIRIAFVPRSQARSCWVIVRV